MDPATFLTELKRRKVYRVAVAYAIVAWLLIQAASILFPTFEAPAWVMKVFISAIILGFPVALIFAWAFEITPEGIKRAEEVDLGKSITHRTGRKLDFLIIAVLLLVIAVFAYQRIGPGRKGPAVVPDKSIAVLPFENLSSDKENAFFTDGVQDEILTNLARIADLKVISRTSVMQYKSGVARNLRKIGEELGVAHVVEGSVQRASNKVRVNAQLIDARNDRHEWAENYDRPIDDVFAIQSEIAKAIADQLQAKLSPNEKASIGERPTADVVAFEEYSKAKTLLLVSRAGGLFDRAYREAIDLLTSALKR